MTKIDSKFLASKEFEKLLTQYPKIVKSPLRKGQYVTTKHTKTSIVGHHTAGSSASGALSWWDQTPERVGVAFVIDRVGTIFEAFDPSYFAYHLGLKGILSQMEKYSIGVELVSVGGLYKDGNGKACLFKPLYPKATGEKVIPDDEIMVLKKEYRGFTAFQIYTDEQIIAFCQLVAYLTSLFPSIKLPKILSDTFYEYDGTVAANLKPGLFSHSTVRKDKSDMAPQPNLIAALKRTCELLTTPTK